MLTPSGICGRRIHGGKFQKFGDLKIALIPVSGLRIEDERLTGKPRNQRVALPLLTSKTRERLGPGVDLLLLPQRCGGEMRDHKIGEPFAALPCRVLHGRDGVLRAKINQCDIVGRQRCQGVIEHRVDGGGRGIEQQLGAHGSLEQGAFEDDRFVGVFRQLPGKVSVVVHAAGEEIRISIRALFAQRAGRVLGVNGMILFVLKNPARGITVLPQMEADPLSGGRLATTGQTVDENDAGHWGVHRLNRPG